MSVDYKWANAVMDQLKGCQAENARLREEAAAMTTAIQKVEYLESEIARLRGSTAEQRFCEPPVAGSTPAAGFLTDAELEAVTVCANAAGNCNGFGGDPTRPAIYNGRDVAVTLRGLLERTQ